MDILEIIGETSFVEKKEMLEKKKVKSWLKTVSAFANTSGGKIIWGINDNDELVGLENCKDDMDKISEGISSRIEPTPDTKLYMGENKGKSYIVLEVLEGKQTPYYYKEGGTKDAFIRVGNESVKADHKNWNKLVLKGMGLSFDQLKTTIEKDRVSFFKFKSLYYQRTGREIEESDFVSFNMVEGKYLTNTGVLLSDQDILRQSRIFATRWNGKNKANGKLEALDDKEFQGGILFLLQSAEEFIKSNSKKMWKKGEKYRIEYPDYPEIAVREALVNALIHRDYNETGSEIHISMYDDRLEIYSPGGMYSGILIEEQDIANIQSNRRNPFLADVFGRMHLMERRGSGLTKIIETYKTEKNYNEKMKPEFKSTVSSFTVILKNLNYISSDNEQKSIDKAVVNTGKLITDPGEYDESSDKQQMSIDKSIENTDKISVFPEELLKEKTVNIGIETQQEKQIYNYASKNGTFKTKDIEELLYVKSARARRILAKMVEKGILKTKGKNRNRMYLINDKNQK